MKTEIYYGNLKKCIYTGYAGNLLGVGRDEIVEEGIFFVKTKESEYVKLDDLMSNRRVIIKDYATKVGELFASDLVLLNSLVQEKSKQKQL